MKKIWLKIIVVVMLFGGFLSSAFAGNVFEDAGHAIGNSVKNRFQKPWYDLRNDMLVGDSNDNTSLIPGAKDVDDKVNLWVGARNVNFRDHFLGTVQTYLFTLVGLVAVAMFIYTGFKLFTANGNEKEYSQAWKALAYTVVGLVVIPLSYVLVKIALGFTL